MSGAHKIEFIYFDVGGVVILDFSKTNKWNEMALDLGVSDEKSEDFKKFFAQYQSELHRGEIDLETIQKSLVAEFGLNLSSEYNMLEDFVSRFEPNPSIHPFIQEVSKKCKIGLLTNMYPGMLNCIKTKGLLPHVEWDVVIDSTSVGLEKPKEEILVLAEREAKVAAERILFVDNLTENIEAAQARAWQTFLFDPSATDESSKQLATLCHL